LTDFPDNGKLNSDFIYQEDTVIPFPFPMTHRLDWACQPAGQQLQLTSLA
jgi:hypothetical protein